MSLRLLLVVAVVLIVLIALAVLGVLWWRARKRPRVESGGVTELRRHARAVLRRLSRRARESPLFVVVGDAGAGKSRLIREELARRADFEVIASEAGLTSYVSAERCIDELSSALIDDASEVAGRAFTELWRAFDAGVAVVVFVVDRRSLAGTSAEAAGELGARLRTLLGWLENAGQRKLEIRVALTHLDGLPGYAAFSEVVGERSGCSLPLASVPDPSALARAFRPCERRVATALTLLEGGAFRDVVRLMGAVSADIARLAPFASALLRHEPSGRLGALHLAGAGPAPWLSNPFAGNSELREVAREAASRAAARRAVRTVSAAGAAIAAAFALHMHWLRSAEERVLSLASAEEAARRTRPSPSETPAPAPLVDVLVDAGTAAARLRYWALPGVFVESRRHVRARYLEAVQQGFLLPAVLRAPTRAGFTYAAALERAAPDNAYGLLIAGLEDVWSHRINMPARAVADFMRVNADRAGAPSITGSLPHLRPSPATWGELLSAVGRALGAGQIGAPELERLSGAALLATLPESSREYLALRDADALLASAGALQGVDEADPPGFVGKNLVSLNRLRTLLEGSTVAPSGKPPATLLALAASLKSQPSPPPASAARFEIRYGDRVYALSDAEWAALVLRSKTRPLIAEFVHRGGDGAWPFFDPAALPDDLPAASTEARGYARPLPGMYTRAGFERFVLPVLTEAQAGFSALPLDDQDRRVLVDFVRRSFAEYARAYGRELRGFYNGFFFRPSTASAVEREIEELTNPASWFADFVAAVGDNAATPPKGAGAEPLATELRPYASLVSLAKGSALKDYGALFVGALPAAKEAPAADAEPSLATVLSSVGRAAMPPAKAGTATLEGAVRAWLDKGNVSGERREPFLAPARLLSALGRAEIDGTVEGLWQKRVFEPLRPLLRRFPFDPSANDDAASLAEIEAELAPDGRFWKSFRAYVAPVCAQDGDRYSMRSGYAEPQGMLRFVNAAAAFSTALWDTEGKRRVWLLDVTPVELPPVRAGEAFVAQARLSVGGDSFYSFNQARSTKRLEFRFWTEGTSRVSIELRSGESDDGVRSSVERKGAFSLLRLLQLAERDGETYRWRFPPGAAADGIEFQIEPDPRRAFIALRSAQP